MQHSSIASSDSDRQAQRLVDYDLAVSIVTRELGPRPTQTVRLPHPSQPYPIFNKADFLTSLENISAMSAWDRRVRKVCQQIEDDRLYDNLNSLRAAVGDE